MPRAHKARVAAAVWHLEAVRGPGDAEVARVAELQRGIVARSQLVEAGLSPAAIKHRLRTRHLHVLYPGVYLFGLLVEEGESPQLTRSRYERKLLRLIKLAELPTPLVNTKALGYEVDFLWPQQKLVVEFDGFGPHGHREAFETDRLRDQRLVAAGYRVLR